VRLQRELDGIRARVDATVAPHALAGLDRAVARLHAAGVGAAAPRAGDAAPDFQLEDHRGRPVRLADATARGPVVLVFTRGVWCAYCAATVRAWQRALPLLRELGAELLMVTAQSREHVARTVREERLAYAVLTDRRAQVAARYGIAYEIEGEYRDVVQGEFGLDIGAWNGTLDWRVPVSASFVIGGDGRVGLAHVDPDHRLRLDPEDALAALARLREPLIH
jgi:peroxiredoxin